MLKIDKMSRTPIYEQVIEQVRAHILLGVYPPGEPLPSVRALSVSLGVNPNTLQKAYAELERSGITQSVPGSGRFVADDAKERLLAHSLEKRSAFIALAKELLSAGVTREELHGDIDAAVVEQEEAHD